MKDKIEFIAFDADDTLWEMNSIARSLNASSVTCLPVICLLQQSPGNYSAQR